jgi:hypothetical protein
MAGNQARHEPRGANSWRRLAEFRGALERPPLGVLLEPPSSHGGHSGVRSSAEDLQSQAATQPIGGDTIEEDTEVDGREAAALAGWFQVVWRCLSRGRFCFYCMLCIDDAIHIVYWVA